MFPFLKIETKNCTVWEICRNLLSDLSKAKKKKPLAILTHWNVCLCTIVIYAYISFSTLNDLLAIVHIYRFDSFTSTAISILPSMGQDTLKYLECKFSSCGLSLCFTSVFCNSNQRYLLSLRQASDVFTSSWCRSTQLYVTKSLLLKIVLKI